MWMPGRVAATNYGQTLWEAARECIFRTGSRLVLRLYADVLSEVFLRRSDGVMVRIFTGAGCQAVPTFDRNADRIR